MNTKFNTHESEDSELMNDKNEKQPVDEWFDNLDKDAPENEPEEHLNKYFDLKQNKLQLC